MKTNLASAVILAFGLIVGGFLAGGRYTVVASGTNAVARLDRYTGAVSMCVPGTKGDACGFILDEQYRPAVRR